MDARDHINRISTDRAPLPAGHYSQATVAAGQVYISGQLPIRTDRVDLRETDFETQATMQGRPARWSPCPSFTTAIWWKSMRSRVSGETCRVRTTRQTLNSVVSFFFTGTPLIRTYCGRPFFIGGAASPAINGSRYRRAASVMPNPSPEM